MNRRTLAGAIVVTWLGALAWLGYREIRSASASGIDDTLRTVPPGAAYYVVSVNDVTVGYASKTVDTVPEGILVDDRLILELPGINGLARTDRRTVANLTNTFELRDFTTTIGSDRGGFVTSGTVSDTGILDLELNTGESRYASRVTIGRPVTMQAYLPLRLAFGRTLSPSDTLRIAQFDPVQWNRDDLGLEILADTTLIFPDSAVWDSLTRLWVPARWDTLRAWKVHQSVGDQQTELWIDELGQLVSVETASGFTVSRTAFEIAFHNFRNRSAQDPGVGQSRLVHQTAIAAGVTSLPDNPTEMRFTIADPRLVADRFIDGRQSISGDTLVVRRNDDESLRSTLRLPGSPSGSAAAFLAQAPGVQSDDPRVQARARLIIDGTRNASRATNRLVSWVHNNIAKRPAVGVPSAVAILETQVGDSYEHTTLFIALARAVGLPTRPAAGLIFVDGLFYYHVWAEVDMGSGWVAVDPTFGQVPADANHIRFTSDLPAGDIEMVQLIGGLQVTAMSEEE